VGNIDAEALWRTFGVRSGAGFTFHDLYINIAVDMGFVGLGVCLIFLVATVFSVGAWVMAQPGPESAFFGAVLLIFLLRSYVEVEFPVQFGSMTFLLFSAWGLSRGVLAEHAQASPQERVTPVMRGRLIPNSPKPQ
jgi:exopolysaccharide production protein ExoQ